MSEHAGGAAACASPTLAGVASGSDWPGAPVLPPVGAAAAVGVTTGDGRTDEVPPEATSAAALADNTAGGCVSPDSEGEGASSWWPASDDIVMAAAAGGGAGLPGPLVLLPVAALDDAPTE